MDAVRYTSGTQQAESLRVIKRGFWPYRPFSLSKRALRGCWQLTATKITSILILEPTGAGTFYFWRFVGVFRFLFFVHIIAAN